MPRPKIDSYVTELLISVYKNGMEVLDEGPPTNRQVHQVMKRILGESCPSERWVSTHVAQYLELMKDVFNEPYAEPLGPKWPKDSKQIKYLAAITSTNNGKYHQRFTAAEISAALELQDILELGDEKPEKRIPWFLPSASGLPNHRGEIELIREVAARRAIAERSDVDVPFSDIYRVISFKPWIKKVPSKTSTGIRFDELRKAYPTDDTCLMDHLVKGFWCPPVMRMEVSGVESVRSMARFYSDAENVVQSAEYFRDALVNHHSLFYELFGASVEDDIDDTKTMEDRHLSNLRTQFGFASDESRSLLNQITELCASRPNPEVIEREFGATSLWYLDVIVQQVENAWNKVREVRWGHIDGPLVGGYGEMPDIASWSKPEAYGTASGIDYEEDGYIDDLPF